MSAVLDRVSQLTARGSFRLERAEHPTADGDRALRLTAWPTTDSGLPIVVEARAGEIAVELGAWRKTWSGADDEDAQDDALDLVAAAVFGRAVVWVHHAGDRPVRWVVGFGPPGRWQPFTTVRRFHWRLWQRERVETLHNEADPADLELGEGGRLPYAPWVGTLARESDEPTAQPIELDGVLDLHPIPPKQVAHLVREYIDACQAAGVLELRLIHGKGIGALRRTVHAQLDKHPAVAEYRLGGHGAGSWGATIVTLRAR